MSKKTIISLLILSTLSLPIEAKHHYTNDSITCLTANIINEAGGEGIHGMKAVAATTMNRLLSKRFANTICGIVYQPKQFSWVGKKSSFKTNPIARKIAEDYIHNYTKAKDVTNGATHFHSGRSPGWKGVTKIKRIGNHIFYRIPGIKISYNEEIQPNEIIPTINEIITQNKPIENLFNVYQG